MQRKNSAVLGLFVTDTSVEGVLLRKDETGRIHFIGRYSKQRARRGESALTATSLLPGLKDRSESDYTMEIGDGSEQTTDLFLSREFGGAEGTDVAEKVRKDTSVKRSTTPFGAQLRDILSECRVAGYPSPVLAFCIGSSEVTYHELGLQLQTNESSESEQKTIWKLSKEDKKTLIARLEDTVQGEIDKKRIAFVPMVGELGRRRYMAVVPSDPDPVVAALDVVARTSKKNTPVTHVVDSELSLISSMIRRRTKVSEGVTAVVRVNANDTMVLFLKDGVLKNYEHLRSLTSYDPIDTVCSRVVLKQDELRIGTIDELFVSTEHQATSAIESFSSFFPETNIRDLKSALDEEGIDGSMLDDLRPSSIPAAGVALRILNDWARSDKDFPSVNLLDKRRRGTTPRTTGSYAWHTVALLVVLFVVALFYTWQYMNNQSVIDIRNEELRLNPPQFPTENAAILSARVDSLEQVSRRYNRAMFVLDSLLTGSDKWSSTLNEMTQSTRRIRNIWLKAWTPAGNSLRLEGNALQRNRIAALAQQWNGSIQKLNFAEIQGIRVYTFIMTVPVKSELPKVAQFLRQNSLDHLDPAESEALTSMSEAAFHANVN